MKTKTSNRYHLIYFIILLNTGMTVIGINKLVGNEIMMNGMAIVNILGVIYLWFIEYKND